MVDGLDGFPNAFVDIRRYQNSTTGCRIDATRTKHARLHLHLAPAIMWHSQHVQQKHMNKYIVASASCSCELRVLYLFENNKESTHEIHCPTSTELRHSAICAIFIDDMRFTPPIATEYYYCHGILLPFRTHTYIPFLNLQIFQRYNKLLKWRI